MPTVPNGEVADPFGTRDKGKDQSRIPQGAMPAPKYLMMAAATMKAQGLFDKEPLAPPQTFEKP